MRPTRSDRPSIPGARFPAGLYVHLPFCRSICPYCVYPVRTGSPADRRELADLLLDEIELWRAAAPGGGGRGRIRVGERDRTGDAGTSRGDAELLEEVSPGCWRYDSVYLGGGTPSLVDPGALHRLLEAVRSRFRIEDAGVALEANPEDLDSSRTEGWLRAGVDTVHVGVQSFHADDLRLLGRRHGPDRARESVREARRADFETVSVDLLFGLPGQGVERWRDTLDAAVALEPDHVCCYELTPDGVHRSRGAGEGGRLAAPPDGRAAEMLETAHALLADSGYRAYELCSFARAPRHRSRHTWKYSSGAAYLGLGPSAHSFDGDRRRWWNRTSLAGYRHRIEAGRPPLEDHEILGPRQRALETVMAAFRTPFGVDLDSFETHFGVDLMSRNRDRIEAWVDAGIVRLDGRRLVPSLRGMALADELAATIDLGELPADADDRG